MTTTSTRGPRAKAWLTLAALFILGASLAWGLVIFLWSLAAHTGPSNPADIPSQTVSATPTVTGARAAVAAVAAAPSANGPEGEAVTAARDELANRPMASVSPAAAQPQPLALAPAAGGIVVPGASDPAAGLPRGFPRTPAGAVAQLASIDAAAFRDVNPAAVADVHRRVTRPGAVPLSQWSPNVGVTAILRAVGKPDGATALTSTWTLTHAQVKGVLDRGDFVLACVLGELDATYHSTARAGVGDCQRMLWAEGRWWIGPGAQPAYAPSTWPGSADCVAAGWQEAHHA